MTHRFLLTAVLLMTASVAHADERDAVVRVDGCTGFIVADNLLVTAKQCRPERSNRRQHFTTLTS